MMRAALLCLVACASAPARPTPQWPEYERIDVFGSKQLSRDKLLATWGGELAQLVRDAEAQRETKAAREAVEAKLRAAGDFAFAKISIITYFSPNRSYLTVDLVDAADRARRMTFAPAPTGTHPDPDGLIALWKEYEEKAFTLLLDGKIDQTQQGKCPFWHCITFAHESLATYKDAFAKRVPPVTDALATILRDDTNDEDRATAAFLLAHIDSGRRVVELMVPAIRDASSHVRNNAMRVLALIAQDHPELPIPLEPVIAALQYPETTDRNKASAILDGIARHADAATKAQIEAKAGNVLREMAALRQPNNRDFAVSILKAID